MADLIERRMAYIFLTEYYNHRTEIQHRNLREALSRVPEAQPEQKVGKWIRHEDEDGEPYGHNCSICGEWYVMPYGKTKFCPNCGAKMEEQDADGA